MRLRSPAVSFMASPFDALCMGNLRLSSTFSACASTIRYAAAASTRCKSVRVLSCSWLHRILYRFMAFLAGSEYGEDDGFLLGFGLAVSDGRISHDESTAKD